MLIEIICQHWARRELDADMMEGPSACAWIGNLLYGAIEASYSHFNLLYRRLA